MARQLHETAAPDQSMLKTVLTSSMVSVGNFALNSTLNILDMNYALVGDFALLDTFSRIVGGVGGVVGGTLGAKFPQWCCNRCCRPNNDALDGYRALITITLLIGVDAFVVPYIVGAYQEPLGVSLFDFALENFPEHATEVATVLNLAVNGVTYTLTNYVAAGLTYPINHSTPVPSLARAGFDRVRDCFSSFFKKCSKTSEPNERTQLITSDPDDDYYNRPDNA